MNKKVGLFFTPSNNITGCSKVAYNTLKGLHQIGVEVLENKLANLNGCLHGTVEFHNKALPKNTLIGPEIVILPTDNKGMYNRWGHYIHPSLWVSEYMQTFPIAQNAKHYYWPVGIDTEQFKKREHKKKWDFDCLIYYKNVTQQTPDSDLRIVEQELRQRGLTHKKISYGNYKEPDLIDACSRCRFCIFLAGSESQCLAIMEMMAMNIPIYVLDKKEMKYQSFRYISPNVSSAPYFGNECGIKIPGMDFSKLDDFIKDVDKYKPRDYIMDNHTLSKGAEKYYNILKEVNNVV